MTLKAWHIPGRLNVVADKLSRLGQIIQTEWSLLPEVYQLISMRWHQPQIDLFAMRLENRLPQFVSRVPDSLAWVVDALSLPWEDLDPYAFPPVAILSKVVVKLRDSHSGESFLLHLVAQHDLLLRSGSHVKPDPSVPAQSANSAIRSDST